MEQVRQIIIKLVMYAVITLVVLTLFGRISAMSAILIAIVAGAIAYLVGDLWILANYGNLTSSITDGIIVFLVAWLTTYVVPAVYVSFGLAAVTGVVAGIGDWFFHEYFMREMMGQGGKKEG